MPLQVVGEFASPQIHQSSRRCGDVTTFRDAQDMITDNCIAVSVVITQSRDVRQVDQYYPWDTFSKYFYALFVELRFRM